MKKILVPVDGSVYSDRAIERAREIAKAFDSDVVIFNVIPLAVVPTGRIHYDIHPLFEENKAASEHLLEKAKTFFEGTNIRIETVSVMGDAADAIVDYAKNNGIDLVVMGSHGMGAIMSRILTGSVTTKVLHHIDVPVLVIK